MKHIMNRIALIGIVVIGFGACKKDTSNQPVLNLAKAQATLTASSTAAIVLDSANAAITVVTLSWDSVKFGFSYASTYTLQFDAPSDSFKSPINVVVTGYTDAITGNTLNNLANSIGLLNGTSNTLDVRLSVALTQVGTGQGSEIVSPVYSNVIALTLTPYYVAVPLTYLWVPGAYQGWAPGTAPQLGSQNNTNYEGFVMITAAGSPSLCYKYTTIPAWSGTGSVNYGDPNATVTTNGNVVSDPISATGGNIQLAVPGYYYMQVNVSALNFTGTLISSWSVTGSAVSAPIPLTYDTTTQVWSATGVTLSAGSISFVGNGSTTSITLGQGPQDSYHVANNAKTPVPVTQGAGTYDIKLVLSQGDNYTDTLTKH